VLTGWYTNGVINSTAREVLQGSYNGTVVNLVKGSSLVDGISVGYAATSLPSGFKLLTVNYYDDYTFPDGPTVFPTGSNNEYEVYYNNSNKKPKGMATGSWIRVLTSASSTDGEKSYTLYDIKGRPVKSYSTNYLGGFISTETKLDFVGKPIYTVTKHLREVGDTPLEIREDFTYSDQDRLLTHVHEIVGQTPPELLTQNEYDEMGQLVKKNVGGNDLNGGMSLQKVDYSYNIRGWLKEINNVDELSMEEPRDLFAFKINYNQPENTLGGQIQELYNGNISETLWTTDSDDLKRSYGYQYDALSRLLKAKYQKQGNETGSYDESLQYDKNGNIRGLQRNGYIDSDDQGMTYPIDDLIYTYDNYNNSNRLLSVYDSSNSLDGFKDGNTSGDDYGYDIYGNMKSDRNKGIDRIYYNHLNLPTKIVFSNSSEIQYLYNAAGVKVMKRVNSTEPNYELEGVTHYLSGFQYKDNELQLFPTAEGYVNVTDGGKFNYVYNYTDHLGNVRVSYSYDDRENELKILEENHYYPFGLKHSYNTDRYDFARDENDNIFVVLEPVDRNKYQYKYNGKEYQDELNLNLYDYGARNYDPAIGRYFTIDNFSEAFYNINPYQYTANNPVKFIDVNGDYIYIFGEDGSKYRYDKGKTYSRDDDGNWNEFAAKEGSYVAQIVGALNNITQGDENSFGSQFLNMFANDDVNVDITKNLSNSPKTKNRNITQGNKVYTDFNQKEKVPTTDGMRALSFPITLAHELAHGLSFNLLNESERSKTWITANATNGLAHDISQDEIFATIYENLIRAEQGLPLRTHYSPNSDGSAVSESRLIKKSKVQNPFNTQYEPTEQALRIWNNLIKSRK
jgi:RHS repeat-associated protein